MALAKEWKLYRGTRTPGNLIKDLPAPPAWRPRRGKKPLPQNERWWPTKREEDALLPPAVLKRGGVFHATARIIEMVNAALYLRRPLLVTGAPGSGKSSLVDAVAYELRMGAPLRWSVTSRSTLRDALYGYDAVGRLQQKTGVDAPIGDFITLGALGTALLPSARPRALLIDEIDKSDLDLPNDLLNVFEEGEFEIPELKRLGSTTAVSVFTSDPKAPRAEVTGGKVECYEFPLMILTSNGEREFPAPFLRRCLRLQMPNPTGQQKEDDNEGWKRLDAIVDLHFEQAELQAVQTLVGDFKGRAKQGDAVATDQLLNAIYFVTSSQVVVGKERDDIVAELTRALIAASA